MTWCVKYGLLAVLSCPHIVVFSFFRNMIVVYDGWKGALRNVVCTMRLCYVYGSITHGVLLSLCGVDGMCRCVIEKQIFSYMLIFETAS